MYFEFLLDAILGPREVLHELECSVCGFLKYITKTQLQRRLLEGRVNNVTLFKGSILKVVHNEGNGREVERFLLSALEWRGI
ncbi:hypothetical protein B1NLA3E_20520 [Bacillus sp. 1NLA3E]|nr:hypothetical protein B1NLA3E_20520 [Bacillus sp. 1NLA3E]